MRFFLDTEFIENGPDNPIQLVSLALVAETGEEFYVVSKDFDPDSASDWVKANVFPHLVGELRTPLKDIGTYAWNFVEAHRKQTRPEFWGYYADYDWVVFCQTFGNMLLLPPRWPMYCRDLKQWADDLGNPKLPEQRRIEHCALNDARWNLEVFQFLNRIQSVRKSV